MLAEDGLWYPRPTQIKLHAGDAVLAHFLTAHGPMEHHGSEARMMIYFRVTHADVVVPHSGYPLVSRQVPVTRGAEALCDVWRNWEGLRGEAAEHCDPDAKL